MFKMRESYISGDAEVDRETASIIPSCLVSRVYRRRCHLIFYLSLQTSLLGVNFRLAAVGLAAIPPTCTDDQSCVSRENMTSSITFGIMM
jgi:hypothetical protein